MFIPHLKRIARKGPGRINILARICTLGIIMRTASALFALIITSFAYSQAKHLKHETIIKTNILSLFAARPSVSFEKLFREKLSLEVSFVQGEFYNLLYTDHYGYDGILIRLKKYFSEVSPGCPLPYEALYLGNLNRKTQTE